VHLLYLDASGNESDPTDSYFVLRGLALFERQICFLAQAIDKIQEDFFPNRQPIPFHLTDIRAGKKFWRKGPASTRTAIIDRLIEAVQQLPDADRLLYGAAVEKDDQVLGGSGSRDGYRASMQAFRHVPTAHVSRSE
jgi:hypothetical protein